MIVIVAIRDLAVGSFVQPMFFPSRQAAVRAFSDECNRKDSQLRAHPADYSLWLIGEFDEIAGEVSPLRGERLCEGMDVCTLIASDLRS